MPSLFAALNVKPRNFRLNRACGAYSALPLLALSVLATGVVAPGTAFAQFGGARGPGGGGQQQSAPTQSGPTQQKSVGPRAGQPAAEEEEDPSGGLLNRGEPTAAPPADPLAMPKEVHDRIGSDWDGRPPSPTGDVSSTRLFPWFEQRHGDYRFRMVPPLYFEQTRGLTDPSQKLTGIPAEKDTESLSGLFYYHRRSPKLDANVLFPLVWHVRDDDSHLTVVGPLVHRQAPHENDNWLAPLYFAGAREHGGYFHSPLLLTTSHWSDKGAFTMVGPYFRDRTERNVDMGIAPLFFSGDNGDIDGNRRKYTLIPPLLFYHSSHEATGTSFTVAGPVIAESNPKRDIFDVAPFYFHISGKPESGGVKEEHTTLLPFFHYGHTADSSLFVVPGYLRSISPKTDTMVTPFYSRSVAKDGSTSFEAAGPIVPLYFKYSDRDLKSNAWALAPLVFHSESPTGNDWVTPLFAQFENKGVSKTTWVFPNVTHHTDTHGWETDIHPLVYTGRSDTSSHVVVAPIFWDFWTPTKRSTVAFPFYWHFSDTADGSVTQVAGNTVYIKRRVPGGSDWQFHVVPFFAYGENPAGYFWNVLYGLAGYERAGSYSRGRAFWIPFDMGGTAPGAPLGRATAKAE